MKKLVSLTLALLIALIALLPAMAEETHTIRTGVLSMLNVTEMDEFKGGVTCNTAPSKDGQNHYTLLYKKAVNS